MQGLTRKLVGRVARRQGGFTLVEMLVVVGIIVALAAVIIPSVASFIGAGDEGAQDAEMEVIQTAMYSMMADQGITKVDAHNQGADTPLNDFSAQPTGTGTATLDGYLTDASTAFYYCWNASGKIVGGYTEASGVVCTDTPDFS